LTLATRIRGQAIGAFLSPTGQALAAALRHLRHGGLPGRGELELYHDPADPISHLLVQKVAEAGLSGRLYIVGAPRDDVNPDPVRRQRWRLDDARRLADHHGLRLGEGCGEGVEQVRDVLAVPRAFDEHIALAVTLGNALWSGGRGLTQMLAGRDTAKSRSDDRLRARGFYEGGAIYWRGHWFPGLNRWDHFQAARTGQVLGPPRTPDGVPALGPDDTVICYFSFRSPYSYVALERLFSLIERTQARLEVRPVLPMVMRGLAVPRIKRMFLVQDAVREARRYAVPFGRIADPVGAGVERCLAVFCAIEDPQQRHLFLRTAARGIWSEAQDMATDAGLRWATEQAAVPWSTVQDALVDAAWRQQVEDNRQALLVAGLWGVPCFTVGERALWGQDRLIWLGR